MPKAKQAEIREYICTKKVWHKGRLYKRHNSYMIAENTMPRDENGKLEYFIEANPDVKMPEPIADVVKVNDKTRTKD